MNAKQEFDPNQTISKNSEDRVFAREELVYNVTEDLLIILEDYEISKKELATRLGKSKAYVTQILSGSRNMTLGSLSDICFALGFKPQVNLPVQDEPNVVADKSKLLNETWVTQEKIASKYRDVINKSTNVIDRTDFVHWAKVA